ncbi:MAG: basic amino acid/polyamine antiporter [Actinomycetaceae bacterium]|nr:basic amino acid/polyamine antiporter [Actinomycetaceae bacterium]
MATTTEKEPRTLHVFVLTALVVGSMIGAGIFGLPSQMARVAAPGPLILGWAWAGFGMLTLTIAFQSLALRRPDIDGGIYGYARAGFGDYIGFCSSIGYWIGAVIGNVSFLVLLMASLGTFFPIFKDGNTVPAIIGASLVLWVVHFLVWRGIHEAAGVNVVVTIAKVIPLVAFIGVALYYFNPEFLTENWWGTGLQIYPDGSTKPETLGGMWSQIVAMMLITVWVFSGVEGAGIFSKRARSRKDVGTATIAGYLFVLALLILVNLLSYGIIHQTDLSKVADPSLAGLFAQMVGPWGAKFIAIGLSISLVGILLSWTILCTEILRIPAFDGVVPAKVGIANKYGTPPVALWASTLTVQALLVWTAISDNSYQYLILLASGCILIPYVWSALYQLKESFTDDPKAVLPATKLDKVVGVISSLYALWLIYAGGMGYLMGSLTLYFLLTGLFVYAKKESNAPRVFAWYEWIVLAVLATVSVAFVVLSVLGIITI